MSIETVTTILTDPEAAAPQLTATAGFARAHDAHLQVLAVGIGFDYPGLMQTALDAVPVPKGIEEGTDRANQIAGQAKEVLTHEDIRWSVDTLPTLRSTASPEIVAHVKFSDLVIHHRRSDPSVDEQNAKLAETVLFDADTPLLILPQGTEITAPADDILVAWDESATALRAARLALPLLKAARKVHVAIVDPSKDSAERSDPGGAFAQFLARHGVRTEVTVMNKTDATIAGTLQRRAKELGCDLIVMGAYGHSRLRQAIFGGTTRFMLEKADMPVFLAH